MGKIVIDFVSLHFIALQLNDYELSSRITQ